MSRARDMVGSADVARCELSAGGDVRRKRHELRDLQRGRRARRAVPVRRPRQRDARSISSTSTRSSGTPTCRTSRPASGTRYRVHGEYDPASGKRFNPAKLLLDPYAKAVEGQVEVGPGRLRLHVRRTGLAQRRGLRRQDDARRRRQPVLRLGGRPAAADALCVLVHLRGPRQGHDGSCIPTCPKSCAARTAASRIRRSSTTSRSSASPRSSSCRCTSSSNDATLAGEGALELLGVQQHRVLRPAEHLRRHRRARRAGAGVQGHGAGAAPRRHRGHPRCRLQPHRRGQPPRTHTVVPRHRQRGVLPPAGRRQAALRRLHRHRQLAERASAAHACS